MLTIAVVLIGCDEPDASSMTSITSFDTPTTIKCPICEKEAVLLQIETSAFKYRKSLWYRCEESHQTFYTWDYMKNKWYMHYSRKVTK